MPSTCSVAECKNNSERNRGIVFHRFPSNPAFLKSWIIKCKRKGTINTKIAKVCSSHFIESDYERDLQHELLGLPLRKILKTDAIPTVFLDRINVTKTCNTERTTRAAKRKRKEIIEEVLEEINDEVPVPKMESAEITDHLVPSVDNLLATITSQREVIIQKEGVIQRLQLRINQILGRKRKRSSTTLSKVFSSTQIQLLQKKKKRVNWTQQDIVKALAMRSLKLKSYETAQEIWGIPLPSPRTLRRWISRFDCRPGIQFDILSILKEKSLAMDEVNKVCILSFDEMSLNSSYVHDVSFDCIYSKSKVQVVMIRGLYEKWKQPIYFDFDVAMSEDLLKLIIKAIRETGFHVVAVVSDLGGENRSVWKSLSINETTVTFPHPCDKNQNVFVIADVPHLLKLIRNHLLDDGVILTDGTIINKATLENMLDHLSEKNIGDFTLCPKLSEWHLNLQGQDRMRVFPAAQLFSAHVAALAKKVYPDNPSISDFFLIINNGFDVLNSRIPLDSKNALKSGFGMKIAKQLEALDKLEILLTTMKFMKKHNLKIIGPPRLQDIIKPNLPCQKGFSISVNAVRRLSAILETKYKMTYMLTSRLNQDCLESFFLGSELTEEPIPALPLQNFGIVLD